MSKRAERGVAESRAEPVQDVRIDVESKELKPILGEDFLDLG
jgi:hypothetical protein